MRFEIAGDGLAEAILPALAPFTRAPGEGEPSLRIRALAGGPSPFGLLPPSAVLANGEVVDEGTGQHRHRVALDAFVPALYAFDCETRVAHASFRSATDLPAYVRAAPFRAIFGWWAEERGHQLVHAAAVGLDDGAVLLGGPSGSGKSTTSLACALSGLRSAGDDYVLVSLNQAERGPRVHRLFNTTKIELPTLARSFPNLLDRFAFRDDTGPNPSLERPRGVFFLEDLRSDALGDDLPLRAILLPVRAGRLAPRLVAISSGEALRGLVPSTLAQLPGARGGAVARLSSLVRSVPAFRLELGGSLSDIVALVARTAASGPAPGPITQSGR